VAVHAEVVSDPAVLTAAGAEWDALADACSRPFCLAEWLLAWWEHARPPRARLAVVLVRDRDALAGVAPFFTERTRTGVVRWRPLGAQTCQGVVPLARPGREPEVAAAIAAALHAHRPRPDILSFEGMPATSPWPQLITAAWPASGTPRSVRTGATTGLALDLSATDFDGWFASKSSHFRQRLRNRRKAAAADGAQFRLADADSAAHDIEAFLRLHGARWEGRGGSQAVTPGVAATLRAAGPGLVRSGRLRIWSLDRAGTAIASGLVFCAGDEVGFWLTGFDDAHAELEPSKLSILTVIEDAFALGARTLDLGEGAFAYKQRFADHETQLVRVTAVLPSARLPLAGMALAPLGTRYAARRLRARVAR